MATKKKVAKKATIHTKPAKKAVVNKAAAKPKKGVVKAGSSKATIKKVAVKKENAKMKTAKKSVPQPAAKKKALVVKSVKKPVEKATKSSVRTSKTTAKIVSNKSKEPAKKATATPAAKKAVSKKAASAKEAPEKVQVIKSRRSTGSSNTVYQPEFIKSVLDQPEQHTGPVYRYSDSELQEFKEIIFKKMGDAKKELVYLQGLIMRKDETGTEDTENKYMSMEDGSGTMEREQLNQMASRQIQFIDHLEKALMRIENKTYGICRVTGKLIDKARLRAVPHATLSIEAKQAMSK
jgi:RNA polymerase-binding transcription factor DksA